MRRSYEQILRRSQEKKQALLWFFCAPAGGILFFLSFLRLLEVGLFGFT
jgi:hypothetical protein